MKRRTALVTGAAGQLGRHLTARLAAEGTRVFGLDRSAFRAVEDFEPIAGDLCDPWSLLSALDRARPDEIYHLAAQTNVGRSWAEPVATAEVTGLAVVHLLEAVRRVVPEARILQASTSELFAASGVSPQDENTPIRPRTPYGAAKAFAHHSIHAFRDRHGLFASTAILYGNESPLRPPDFLFRKVTMGVAAIAAGRQDRLSLGNLEAVRDWGFSGDYADAMVRILRHDVPDDFVVATGQGHTVGEMVRTAFGLVGLDWERYVRVDPALVRPAEAAPMVGDARKARRVLGWAPRVDFEGLVRLMLAHDLRLMEQPVPFEVADLGPSRVVVAPQGARAERGQRVPERRH